MQRGAMPETKGRYAAAVRTQRQMTETVSDGMELSDLIGTKLSTSAAPGGGGATLP